MRHFAKSLFALLLLGMAAIVLVWRDAQDLLQRPLPIVQPMRYEISVGGNLKSIAEDMRARAVFIDWRLPLYLRIYARISGAAANLKAGEYELLPGMSSADLLKLFASGKVMLHEQLLVEGWTFDQARAALAANPDVVHALKDTADAAIMTAIGQPGMPAEGHFFPDTYRFPKGMTDQAFLKRAYVSMDEVLKNLWMQRAENLPYASMEEALIMASIVEKETAVSTERAVIAGVFLNRLRLGMKLQTDPTVIYGLGNHFDGNLRKIDLETDTPYNTYTRAGLPPTAICLPGRASIEAALHPAQTLALYFVARGDGSHEFSETLEAHNNAVNKFQKAHHAK